MPDLTLTGIAPELHRALEARALRNGRSVDAEVRAILDEAVAAPGTEEVRPDLPWPKGASLVEVLDAIAHEVGGVELDIVRDKTPARIPDFG